MEAKESNKHSILEIRRIGRNLGMSRGRITRDFEIERICKIKSFQASVYENDKVDLHQHKKVVKIMFKK